MKRFLMDFAQLGQFIGSIGIPGALLFIIVLKNGPSIESFYRTPCNPHK